VLAYPVVELWPVLLLVDPDTPLVPVATDDEPVPVPEVPTDTAEEVSPVPDVPTVDDELEVPEAEELEEELPVLPVVAAVEPVPVVAVSLPPCESGAKDPPHAVRRIVREIQVLCVIRLERMLPPPVRHRNAHATGLSRKFKRFRGCRYGSPWKLVPPATRMTGCASQPLRCEVGLRSLGVSS
jgi:hypothetical protein